MTMNAETAMRQAHATAEEYARASLHALCKMLDISGDDAGLNAKIAPFVPVWVAMIQASVSDFDTAVRCGAVDGYPAPLARRGIE